MSPLPTPRFLLTVVLFGLSVLLMAILLCMRRIEPRQALRRRRMRRCWLRPPTWRSPPVVTDPPLGVPTLAWEPVTGATNYQVQISVSRWLCQLP
jgi:hypothetical protein